MESQESESTVSTTARLPELPNEVLLMIIQQCLGSTLKNIRLSSKSMAQKCDPILWHSITVVPNTDCLSTIETVLSKSAIACLVKNIVYDVAWNSMLERIKVRIDTVLKTTTASDSKPTSALACNVVPDNVLRGQLKPAEDVIEVSLLSRLMLCLPNARELTVRERATNSLLDSAEMPGFYRRVCNTMGISYTEITTATLPEMLEEGKSHARSLLLASHAVGRDITSLKLERLSWNTFFRAPAEERFCDSHEGCIIKNIVKKLRSLDVSFTGTPSRDMDTQLAPFGQLLRCAENLENLKISFTDALILRRYSTDYRMHSYLAPLMGETQSYRPMMPRLKSLTLNGCTCSQRDLVHFLSLHTSTLRHLRLSDISLLRHEDKDTRGCWVQIIKALRSNLRLRSVIFNKWLSNGGRQRWYVSESPTNSDRIRIAVERFITDKSCKVCPLEKVAIMPDEEDVRKPEDGLEFEGDWTWAMTYGRKERRESTFSGSHFFNADVPLESPKDDNSDTYSPSDKWEDLNPSWNHKTKKIKICKKPYIGSCPKPPIHHTDYSNFWSMQPPPSTTPTAAGLSNSTNVPLNTVTWSYLFPQGNGNYSFSQLPPNPKPGMEPALFANWGTHTQTSPSAPTPTLPGSYTGIHPTSATPAPMPPSPLQHEPVIQFDWASADLFNSSVGNSTQQKLQGFELPSQAFEAGEVTNGLVDFSYPG